MQVSDSKNLYYKLNIKQFAAADMFVIMEERLNEFCIRIFKFPILWIVYFHTGLLQSSTKILKLGSKVKASGFKV
jgi:hypothetical protein